MSMDPTNATKIDVHAIPVKSRILLMSRGNTLMMTNLLSFESKDTTYNDGNKQRDTSKEPDVKLLVYGDDIVSRFLVCRELFSM